jgi:hypothetical protein
MKKNQKKLFEEDPDFLTMEFANRDEKNKRKISDEENLRFKEAFGDDHPDYNTEPPKRKELTQEENDTIMYNGKTREEYWESQKREYPKKGNINFTKKFKFKPLGIKLVRNQILGYQPQEVIDYALEKGFIVKKKWFDNEYFCIPTEEVFLASKKGPVKTSVVSKKYLDFREDLKNNKLKIKKGQLL